MPRYIKITDIGTAPGLSPEDRIALWARALHEMMLIQALAASHGTERGMHRYWDSGGSIFRTASGDHVIRHDPRVLSGQTYEEAVNG